MHPPPFPLPALADFDNGQLPRRRSGRSGLRLPLLTLALGPTRELPATEPGALLHHAIEQGYTAFDVTPSCPMPGSLLHPGPGRHLGRLQARHPHLIFTARIGLATGPGSLDGFGSRKYLLSTLDALLRRTGLDHLDVLYAHRHDAATPLEETVGALIAAVYQGKALYTGLSGYAPAPTRHAVQLLAESGNPAAACQSAYSLSNRWIEGGLLDVLANHGIGTVACAPLHHGNLALRAAHSDSSPSPATRTILARTVLSRIARERDQTPAQLALAWVLRDPRITSALITATHPVHLAENLQTVHNLNFDPVHLTALDAVGAL
ncbi:aldo/keto reductase [Streptomyces sp. NPDC059008]|uniref:aldo/keto reductase n=1 Tax=Streptomyces sp. NPDC059008 TaxID=3346693 RepID=UPI0036A81080